MITMVKVDDYEPLKKAILETVKEAARVSLSLFIGVLLDGLITLFANNQYDSQVILTIGIIVRLLDKYWHVYNRELKPGLEKESLGIFRF